MSLLIWNPYEIIEVLGVLPEIEEYDIRYTYKVNQLPLQLMLSIFPYDADVYFTLNLENSTIPVFDFRLLDCSGIRMINDKRGLYLEFGAGNMLTERYDGYSPLPYGVRLSVTPQLSLEMFRYSL